MPICLRSTHPRAGDRTDELRQVQRPADAVFGGAGGRQTGMAQVPAEADPTQRLVEFLGRTP